VRKIDAMVATHVMKWAVNSSDWYAWKTPEGEDIDDDWSPSTDPAAMMVVVEKMSSKMHKVVIEWHSDMGECKTMKRHRKPDLILSPDLNPNPQPYWTCEMWARSEKYPQCWDKAFVAKGATAALAVCVAALRACAVPESDIAKALEER
jgi:hypothetical protein